MVTTMQISSKLVKKLQKIRMHSNESYENIIWDLMKDRMKLPEETEKTIRAYEEDMKKNNWENFVSLENMKKRN